MPLELTHPQAGALVQAALDDPRFRTCGVLTGQSANGWWAVVDPLAHPLRVWRQTRRGPLAYASTAAGLEAVLFSNGPMMGKRLGRLWKMGRNTAIAEAGAWTVVGMLCGLAPGRRRRVAVVIGGLCGAAFAWRRAFTHWLPCGTVRSGLGGFEDRRNFDGEGGRHVWFGRRGGDFSSYAVGDGDLPADVIEGAAGLIGVVRDGQQASGCSDFADLRLKRGYVVWGLVPLDRHLLPDSEEGVLVVLGSQDGNLEDAATWLQEVGARDAVATDQRGMIMLGGQGLFWIGPPPPHRQAMQQYGLCCG